MMKFSKDKFWELFKLACAKNNTTPTSKIEKWMINFVDKNVICYRVIF